MISQSPFFRLRYPCVMGVVNVTPNSFSDGGQFDEPAAAVAHARELVLQGAQLLDLGAEASSFFRAGVQAVPAGEQLRRLMPVLQGVGELKEKAVISVDTRSAEVAAAAIAAGATVINDISAGVHEPALLEVVAKAGAGIVLMHMGREFPKTPQRDDRDIVETVRAELLERRRAALAAGIAADRIALDPGVGFGKTMADNWRLALAGAAGRTAAMAEATEAAQTTEAAERFGGPLVLGVSRKRFLETPPPPDVPLPGEWAEVLAYLAPRARHPRDAATAALLRVQANRDVQIHRVHDVALAIAALAWRPDPRAPGE